MSENQLRTASDNLRQAAVSTTGEERERIYDHSNQLAELATADRKPDQGRLARHIQTLREIRDETDGETAEHISAAIEAVQEYREGIGGV